jgi:hypothetical protein
MVDDMLPGGGPTPSICPWCSATYTGQPESCPSCNAALTADPTIDPSMPGLTAIDAAAIVAAKQPTKAPRNRLLSWISGEYADETLTPADAAALAPPDVEVRREMLRLELEAEVANLQAEADALIAEAAVEGRGPDATPDDAAAAAQVVEELETVSAELERVDEEIEEMPVIAEDASAAEAAPVAEGPSAEETSTDSEPKPA